MSVQLDERTELDITSETEGPKHAHIVDRGDDPRPARALVLEALVMGTPLTALCGYVWVPSRDPSKLSVCPKCQEMVEFAKDFSGDHRHIL